ncbi:MAG: type II toxin-antitoxin system HicA family toxin [Muribaculaceae bacterium]|nr:type II toxin-antitoxin system HicA family toxin [Bacteroides sp.]MDE6254834.1 type II toxin-antitoxin system HicA family toxin [Muribaculaceae bacterium]
MSKHEKSVARLLSKPKDYNYDEAKALLTRLGFIENNKGKSSGSRVEFIKGKDTILLHKPHPNGDLKIYQIKQLIECLQQLKLI